MRTVRSFAMEDGEHQRYSERVHAHYDHRYSESRARSEMRASSREREAIERERGTRHTHARSARTRAHTAPHKTNCVCVSPLLVSWWGDERLAR
jgi:hypothetical protein